MLEGFIFNPFGAIRWKQLKSLCISQGKLDESLIRSILSGSPLLETLELRHCYGYRQMDITSKSVQNLLCGYLDPEDILKGCANVIEINAPNILSLTIKYDLHLGKLILLNVSSLIKVELDYKKQASRGITGAEVHAQAKQAEQDMLKGFMINLHHVKYLTIGKLCLEVFEGLKDRGLTNLSNINWKSPEKISERRRSREEDLLDYAPVSPEPFDNEPVSPKPFDYEPVSPEPFDNEPVSPRDFEYLFSIFSMMLGLTVNK